MSQVLRVRNTFIHVPSIARLHLKKTITSRPLLIIQEHNGSYEEIKYRFGNWEEAVADYKRIQTSMVTCRRALKDVPFME